MIDEITETKMAAEAKGLKFKDCGNGHVQISGNGQLVNYYPTSKNKTLYSPTLNRREICCTPSDAVSICLSGAKQGIKPKLSKDHKGKHKNRTRHNFTPVNTNPSGIQHFYSGARPPWEGSAFICSQSDRIRIVANKMRGRAVRLEAKADELDYIFCNTDPAELEIVQEARERI